MGVTATSTAATPDGGSGAANQRAHAPSGPVCTRDHPLPPSARTARDTAS